ncbi:MAG: hypothetical protein ABMA25_05900 [Ilumatobacteraceae bacterium]
MDTVGSEVVDQPLTDAVSRCPVDHRALAAAAAQSAEATAAGCPIRHDGSPVQRSKADLFMRRLLRIRERPAGVTAASAYATFQKSMLISATRCTLTYVIFPFVLPAVGFATGIGPVLGIIIGVIALTSDVFTIRRFFAVDHKYRWHFSAVASAVIVLLLVLLVQDIVHLVS